ncbi:MAG: hypothetical protein HY658_00195 [Actinobacteria bacterium]|nr:hypothetical protein [Actinomycetota bacterium]
MRRIIVAAAIVALALADVLAPAGRAAPDRAPAATETTATVPSGFAVTTFAPTGGPPTSLAWGPDTRDPNRTRLYVAVLTGPGGGRVLAIDDAGGVGIVSTFATGFSSPLGVLVAPDGTVFVSDSEGPRDGPFGNRPYGRVWRLRDTDADGVADRRELVLKDLPNGRHNTNGMALGPDGLLYVTNGNSTDDGVEGGEPEALPWSGSVIRVDPGAREISPASPGARRMLVATGMRNLFDVAFSPVDPELLFVPMNGVDDARQGDPPTGQLEDSDDLLFATDTGDGRVDDFGFPSCLYNVARQGDLEPYDNPNPETVETFGPCPVKRVPRPAASFGLHPSADGLAFQATGAWGEDFRDDLFVAEFGNFFGDEVTGHRIVRVELDAEGRNVTGISDFLTGITPLDVTFDAGGTMYVADFAAGLILRVEKVG